MMTTSSRTTVTLSKVLDMPTFEQIEKNTKFKKKYIPGVIETLKWLGSGAPHDDFNGFTTPVFFDMNYYITIEGDDDSDDDYYYCDCRTICCMAGAIRLFTKHKIPLKSRNHVDLLKDFAIDENPCHDLFALFYGYNEDKQDDPYDNNPCQAFITLYNYCMTGIVDWNNNEIFIQDD